MAEKRPSLNVLSGPLAGRNFVLEDAVDNIRIGSDASCGFVLDTPGVSPIHARLWVDLNGATVYETNSPNGVYVNDDRVVKEAPVRNGDILWLGPPGKKGRFSSSASFPRLRRRRQRKGIGGAASAAPPPPPKRRRRHRQRRDHGLRAAEYLVPRRSTIRLDRAHGDSGHDGRAADLAPAPAAAGAGDGCDGAAGRLRRSRDRRRDGRAAAARAHAATRAASASGGGRAGRGPRRVPRFRGRAYGRDGAPSASDPRGAASSADARYTRVRRGHRADGRGRARNRRPTASVRTVRAINEDDTCAVMFRHDAPAGSCRRRFRPLRRLSAGHARGARRPQRPRGREAGGCASGRGPGPPAAPRWRVPPPAPKASSAPAAAPRRAPPAARGGGRARPPHRGSGRVVVVSARGRWLRARRRFDRGERSPPSGHVATSVAVVPGHGGGSPETQPPVGGDLSEAVTVVRPVRLHRRSRHRRRSRRTPPGQAAGCGHRPVNPSRISAAVVT